MILVSNNLTDVPFDFLFTRSCGSTLADGLKVQKNCYNLRIKKVFLALQQSLYSKCIEPRFIYCETIIYDFIRLCIKF